MTDAIDEQETAEEAIARLTAERDHWQQLAEHGLEPRMQRMRFENGEFEMAYTGEVAEAMALAFVGHFKAMKAANYIEMDFRDRGEPYGRYVVAVQKVGAKSPHDKVKDAETRISELEALLAASDA